MSLRPAIALLALLLAAEVAGAAPRNVLLLVTDDQAWDTLGLLDPRVETPHLDRLFRDGTWFTQAAASTPVCPAARLSMLTGLFFPAHRFTFGQPRPEVALLGLSYPALLRERGWRSALIGKNGLNLDDARAAVAFDEWRFFDRDYVDRQGRHLTDRIAGAAERFIERRAGDPWSLVVWFHAPHAEDLDPGSELFVPPARYETLYDGVEFPRRPGSESWPERPALFERSRMRDEGLTWWEDEAAYQHNTRGYHAMVRGVDDAVGRLRAALEATGQAGETLIVFLSDNGLYRGERGFAGKWLGHEASIRIPMAVLDPGRAGGAVSDAPASTVDVAPTVLDLLGVGRPSWVEGASLVPHLGGGGTGAREALFLEHSWTSPGTAPIPRTRGVRTARHKYLEYPGTGYRELYDLAADPDELVNLAGRAELATEESRLRRLTRRLERAYAADVLADGFETRDASRWPQARRVRRGVTILRLGEAPHPWALAPELGGRQRVFVGLPVAGRDRLTASFRINADGTSVPGAVTVALIEAADRSAKLLLTGGAGDRRLVLRAGGPVDAEVDLATGWTVVRFAWDRASKTLSLALDGTERASAALPVPGLRRVRFGLPSGGGEGTGRVRLDEFLVLAR